jgi:hypothetical protein
MNVIAPHSGAQRRKIMKTFTIDADNNITVHTSKKAAKETGAPAFASEAEFAELIGTDNKRPLAIWNSIPGVTPVAKSLPTGKRLRSASGPPSRALENPPLHPPSKQKSPGPKRRKPSAKRWPPSRILHCRRK